MNWEIIRIGIDVLTVLMAIVMGIVLFVAYRSFKKVKFAVNPLMGFGGGMFNPQQGEDGEVGEVKVEEDEGTEEQGKESRRVFDALKVHEVEHDKI